MRNEEDIERRIENIERQLRNLKLELEEIKNEKKHKREEKTGPIKIGDRVNILNPNRGQGNTGIGQKINWKTKRVTVEVWNLRRVRELVVQKVTNVERIEE